MWCDASALSHATPDPTPVPTCVQHPDRHGRTFLERNRSTHLMSTRRLIVTCAPPASAMRRAPAPAAADRAPRLLAGAAIASSGVSQRLAGLLIPSITPGSEHQA